VYVLLGSRSFGSNPIIDLAQQAPDLVIHGAGDRFGAAIGIGDAGGPATSGPIADLLIGAPGGSPDSNGSAYLLFGRKEFGKSIREVDITSAADFKIDGSPRQRLGAAVAIGDFNGDGIGDLFAGAPTASRPDRNDLGGVSLAPVNFTGAVFAAIGPFPQGGAINSSNPAVISFYGGGTGHQFGTALAAADLTGDGITDLVVGAPNVDGRFPDPVDGSPYSLNGYAGAAYVFAGRAGMTQRRFDSAASEYLTVYIGLGHNWVGFALGTGSYNIPGNADTVPDLLIGRPGGVRDALSNLGGNGAVNVVFGGRTLTSVRLRPRSPLNPALQPDEVAVGSPPFEGNTDFGFAVAAGDLNGDGSGDLIVAAPFVDVAGRSQAGQVLIWLGTTKPPGGGGGGDPTPTVRLVTPAAGEQLVGAKQAVITWSATAIEKVQSFDVLLSTDGGVSFSSSVATGLPASQMSYSWTVPNVCVSNARFQVIVTTTSGERVVAMTEGTFTIAEAGPGVDLSRSSIDDSGLSLTAAGEVFSEGLTIEISTDSIGTTFQGFSRAPKIKSGGRKLKTRGAIDGQGLDHFFPDGVIRVLKLSAAPCATTVVRVQRQGNSLIPVQAPARQ
jgi:hypothetical protein